MAGPDEGAERADRRREVRTTRGRRRRQLALNAITGVVCVGILAALGAGALHEAKAGQTTRVHDVWLPRLDLSGHPTMVLTGGTVAATTTGQATTAAATTDAAATTAAATTAPPAPVTSLDQRPRLLGTAADPWTVDTWRKAIRAPVDISMTFAAWGVERDLRGQLAQAARRKIIPMLTWEPWVPVDTSLGSGAQGALQPRFSNDAIAAGRLDDYIRRVADVVRTYPGPVMIRYAHEMNGDWYPWFHDAHAYRLAWRHVVEVFRAEGATNAVWIWSPNPNFWMSRPEFITQASAYWPGGAYVDLVGTTMVRFATGASLDEYWARLDALHSAFHRPMVLTEVNVDFPQRQEFFTFLCDRLHAVDWVKAVVISQAPSRGQAINPGVGQMDWQVPDDPLASRLVGQISHAPQCAPAR